MDAHFRAPLAQALVVAESSSVASISVTTHRNFMASLPRYDLEWQNMMMRNRRKSISGGYRRGMVFFQRHQNENMRMRWRIAPAMLREKQDDRRRDSLPLFAVQPFYHRAERRSRHQARTAHDQGLASWRNDRLRNTWQTS